MLAGLTGDRLAAACREQPKWFMLRFGGKDVGFMVQAQSPAAVVGDKKGFAVRSVSFFVSGKEKRALKRSFFVTSNFDFEQWNEVLSISGVAKNDIEDGTRGGEKISCTLTPSEGAVVTRSAKAPREAYLPRVVGMLLPRLADLSKPGVLGFLSYNAQNDELDTRTFTVEGKDKLRVGDKTIDCVRVSDQLSMTTEPATLYVDEKGELIRMTTAEGLTIDAASADEVAKLFSEAKGFDSFLKNGQ